MMKKRKSQDPHSVCLPHHSIRRITQPQTRLITAGKIFILILFYILWFDLILFDLNWHDYLREEFLDDIWLKFIWLIVKICTATVIVIIMIITEVIITNNNNNNNVNFRQRFNEYVLCVKKNKDEAPCGTEWQSASSICPNDWVSVRLSVCERERERVNFVIEWVSVSVSVSDWEREKELSSTFSLSLP